VPLLVPIREVEEGIGVEPLDRLDDDVDTVRDPNVRLGSARNLDGRRRDGRLAQSPELLPQRVQLARPLVDVRPGVTRRQALDPPHARSDRALREDRQHAHLGRRADVRATAELDRVARDLHDADDVAVLLTEEHRRPEPPRLVDRRLEHVHRQRLEDDVVDASLHLPALLGGERRVVGEVEAKLVRPHRRPRLAHVLAQHLAERLMEEVGPGVVRHGPETHFPWHDRLHAIALGEAAAAQEQDLVAVEAIGLDELGTHLRLAVTLDPARVRHLPSTRGVERRRAQLRQEVGVPELL
jgi:hypothetical protein